MSNFGSRILGFFGGTSGGGGGGGVNPTPPYMPYNNAGTFADSYWLRDTNYTYTTNAKGSGTAYGFGVDFANSITYLGDWNNVYQGASLSVDNVNKTIQTRLGNFLNNKFGLFVDSDTAVYVGDYDSQTNYTFLEVNKTNSLIQTNHIGFVKGLLLDFGNSLYKIGTFDNQWLEVDATANYTISTYFNNVQDGFYTSYTAGLNQFGNFGANDTYLYSNENQLITRFWNGSAVTDSGFSFDYQTGTYLYGELDAQNFLSINTNTLTADYYIETFLNSLQFGFQVYINDPNQATKKTALIGGYNGTQGSIVGTNFGVDDANQLLNISSNLRFTPTVISTGTYLKIRFLGDSVDSYIELYEDSE